MNASPPTMPHADLSSAQKDLADHRWQLLKQAALAQDCRYVWGVLDVAADEQLHGLLPQHRPAPTIAGRELEPLCLYDGQAGVRYARYAPYLLLFSTAAEPTPLLARWLAQGWEKGWGIFLCSKSLPQDLKRHLKKLHIASGANRQKLLLRFYDPRVLPSLLAGLSDRNRARYFGSEVVRAYFAPLADGGMWQGTLALNHWWSNWAGAALLRSEKYLAPDSRQGLPA